MKKLFFLLLVTITLVACNGCEPINPPEPPPVKIKQFTVTATVIGNNGTISPTSAVVDSGKSIILTITPSNGFVVNTFKVNNIPVLLTSLSYIIYNVPSKQYIEVTFKYKYDEGTPEWYFTQFVWVEISWFSKLGKEWYDFTDDSTKKTFWYNPDGTCAILFLNNIAYTDWSVDKTTNPITLIVKGGYPAKVDFINSEKMILIFTDNSGVINKITYTNDGVRRFK